MSTGKVIIGLLFVCLGFFGCTKDPISGEGARYTIEQMNVDSVDVKIVVGVIDIPAGLRSFAPEMLIVRDRDGNEYRYNLLLKKEK